MSSSQEFNSKQEEVVDFGIYYLDIVKCPLDPHHKLRRNRLPYHIAKCKKNFPDKECCPFNNTHYFDKCDMIKHLSTCPQKPKLILSSMQSDLLQAERTRNENIVYNYDVNNHVTEEPYWD